MFSLSFQDSNFFVRCALFFSFFAGNLTWAVFPNLPEDLLYLSKPIDSLCFFQPETSSETIRLNQCGLAKEKGLIKKENAALIKQGFIGFDWQTPNTAYTSQGYSYYKPLNAGQHQYWIYTVNNSGGNGEFTAVSFVKRTGAETLQFKNIMAGDRCNGGIQDVQTKNQQLVFSVNLTSYDLIRLGRSDAHALKAYDDLAACAVCCVAKAFYAVDTKLQPKLAYVALNADLDKPAEMSQQGHYQACFNQLIASYSVKHQTRLLPPQLKKLADEFTARCLVAVG